MKAVVLLSGGVDSTTTLAVAKYFKLQIYALSFDYGQTLASELDSAALVARSFGVIEHKIIKIGLNEIGGSLLVKDLKAGVKGSAIPPTYVPARNTVFLSIALGYAEVIEAPYILFGANIVDYSGYPDCRFDYIRSFERTANLSTRISVEGRMRFHVVAPLLYMTKSEIIKLGTSLGVDYAMTGSCYFPDAHGRACGHCESCEIRLKGFKEAGLVDPIPYQ